MVISATRPPTYWAVLIGVVVVSGLAARAGLRLFRAIERAPDAAVPAIRIEAMTAAVFGRVAELESSRRAYALTGHPDHLHALELAHARVHRAFADLHAAAAAFPAVRALAESAEVAVGSWVDDALAAAAARAGGAAGVAHDLRVLGRARALLRSASVLAARERRAANAAVRAAHVRVEWIWLAATGVVVLALIVFVELAYRRRARVAEAARQMDLLLGALPFTLLGIDPVLRIRQATGFIHQVLGIAPRDLLGTRLTDLVDEADRVPLEVAVRAAFQGAPKACEVVTRANGHPARALSIMFSPIREHGEVVAVSAVVHDVSGEHALKAQVLQSDRLATVGALVAGVVHEINNPLSAIVGYAELIDRAQLTPEDRAALDTIASEGQRAAQIARNLLDFSRRRAPAHEPTDLARVVERTVALRRHDLVSHGVQLDLDVAPGLPELQGDAQQLQQVLLNLVVNAEHAVRDRPQPRIVVRLGPGAGVVRLAVEDNGPGVPDDRLEAVFEPFFTTKPEGEGTGLGLSVSRGIVAAHHGRMWVERASLGGARFVVELPASPGAPPAAAPAVAPSASGDAAQPGAAVLVVDDEPANRNSLGRLLQRLGYRVRVAPGALEALATIEQETPDAIISDVHMPGLDGAGFYKVLAERGPALAARTAFMSGDAGEDPVCRHLIERGCVILRKPFELSELQHVVEGLLAKTGTDP
jgi:signal transduction histidine kinase/CheY-like chemotaxis protein